MFQHTSLPLKMALSAALLSVALVGCGNNATEPTTAPDTAAPATTNAASTDAMATNSAAPATANVADFTAASATWTKIQSAKADLDSIIASKKLDKVHEAAFKVRDLVKTLPDESKSLPADKTATLNTQVQNVSQLAGKLDEAGDSNNLKATQDNQAGLGDTLDTIRELYPSGTFK